MSQVYAEANADPYKPVKQDENPDFREAMGEADIDALIDKYHSR